MYTLGIPNRQFRRATSVLGPEAADPIEYDSYKQDDGFWQFSFPEIDEYDFRDIVNLLKVNGITTIGADEQLTDKKIMKLSELIKEQGSPDENEMIEILKRTLATWEQKTYRGGVEDCEKSDHYYEDIKDIIEDYEEEATMDRPSDLPAFGGLTEIYKSLKEQGNTIKKVIDLKMDSEIGAPVTVEYDPTKNLRDVSISWRNGKVNELHIVDFEKDPDAFIEDHGTEGMDFDVFADSDDGRWQFILEVYAEATFSQTGDFADYDFDELIVQSHPDNEDHLEPEDRSDYDNADELGSAMAFDDDGEALASAQDDINTMEEGSWIGDNSFKTRAEVDGNDIEVTVEKARSLDDVTIRWRGSNFRGNRMFAGLKFEPESIGTNNREEGDVQEFTAMAEWDNGDNYIFTIEGYVEGDYEESGKINDWDWDTLEIEITSPNTQLEGVMCEACGKVHEGSCGLKERYERKLLQIRAGIIK